MLEIGTLNDYPHFLLALSSNIDVRFALSFLALDRFISIMSVVVE